MMGSWDAESTQWGLLGCHCTVLMGEEWASSMTREGVVSPPLPSGSLKSWMQSSESAPQSANVVVSLEGNRHGHGHGQRG